MRNTLKKWLRGCVLVLALAMTASCACAETVSVGVIGGADGPTQVIVTQAVAAPETADTVEEETTDDVSEAEIEIYATIKRAKSGVTIEGLNYGYSAAYVGGELFVQNDNLLLRLGAEDDAFDVVAHYDSSYRYFGLEDLERLEAAEREGVERTPSMIFNHGDVLCGLSAATGNFGPIGADGFIEKTVALDWSDMYTQYGVRDMQKAAVIGDALYVLLAPQDMSNGYSSEDMRVTRFDLTTGEARELSLEGEYHMAPYKDGKLLAYAPYGSDAGVQVYDPETDKLGETLVPFAGYGNDAGIGISYNGGGVTYDAASDAVYFAQNGRIFSYANDAMNEIAFIPVDFASNINHAQVLGEMYFCVSWDAIYLCSLRPEDQPERTLRISGGYATDISRAFTEKTGTPVIFDNNYYSGSEAVRNDMLSGSTENDLYVISLEAGARALMEKGYVDAIESPALTADVARMYPQLQEALSVDGTLYAYPQAFYMSLWSYNPQLWEELDLGDYPQTFKEYVELIDLWYTDYADEYPDYEITSLYSGKDELFMQALQHYIYQYEKPGAPLSFNTSVFRETMQAIENLEMEKIDWENLSAEEQEEIWEQMSRPTVFNMNAYETVEQATTFYMTPEGSYEEAPLQVITPPVFEEGAPQVVPVTLSVYIINPESENVDLAIEFLEYWAENADVAMRYAIHTDLTEPVRQMYYEENRKYYEEWIAESEAAMAEADEADKQSYQENIDWMRAELEELEATSWRISRESLDNYRNLADFMCLPLDSLFASGDSTALGVLQEVFMRYLDGQINLETFIREADQKIKMIYLEG